MIEISIVVPVRNESENIKPFLQITESVLKKMEKSYEIIFVLDPSTDDTENFRQLRKRPKKSGKGISNLFL